MTNDHLERSSLNRQVGFHLRQATSAVWADLVETLAPFRLKPQDYATLQIVEASPGCKQQDIANALRIQRPNMVPLIDRLVTQGLIFRQVNPVDRRSNALALTKAGRAMTARAGEAHRLHEARVAAALAGNDAKAVLDALRKLAQL